MSDTRILDHTALSVDEQKIFVAIGLSPFSWLCDKSLECLSKVPLGIKRRVWSAFFHREPIWFSFISFLTLAMAISDKSSLQSSAFSKVGSFALILAFLGFLFLGYMLPLALLTATTHKEEEANLTRELNYLALPLAMAALTSELWFVLPSDLPPYFWPAGIILIGTSTFIWRASHLNLVWNLARRFADR